MKKLFLVDAYALIYRSYYAFISRPMRNAQGMNTSAIFGFLKFLNDILRREQPHYIGVAFDPKGGNFRHELYPDYKANRSETPEDIILATPYIKQILEAMRIPVLEIPGYEADDVIGTLSVKAAHEGFEVYMVTPDKDYGQLVQPHVHIYKQRKSGEGIEIVDMAKIEENYGVDQPKLIADVLALWGDASDNIPGVPGIGEKGAVKLIGLYGDVENIIAHVDEIKGKQGENIKANIDQLRLAKTLATIDCDVPIAFEPEKLIMEDPDCDALAEIYRELNFTSFLRELEQTGKVGAFQCAPSTGSTVVTPQPTAASARSKAAAQPAGPDLFSAMATDTSAAPAAPTDAMDGLENIHSTPHNYITLTDVAEMKALADRLSAADNFAFDTETTGFDVFNDRLVGLSFALQAHEAYYIPCLGERAETQAIVDIFRAPLENPAVAKTAHNAKFDIMVLANYGVWVQGFLYDTMIVHYLLDPESRHGMDFLSRRYLGYDPVPIEALIGKGAKQITMDMVSVDRVAEYGAEDSDVTLRLKNTLWPMLEEQQLVDLYKKIEEPLIRVLASIELEGVRIDAAGLKAYGEALSVDLVRLEAEIREMTGDPGLNVNSAKQLGEALFGRLKLDPNAKKTKTKQYRTDEEYLQSLSDRHPVIGKILEYRGLKKLISTYIDALPQLINPKTGKIHTSFNQAVTATGRLSSNNPNLQNIPIREEQGRMLRKSFIPDAGCVMLSADYSQVELRVMAHLSEDPAMVEAFKENKDIHQATAARIFKVPESEATREQRRRAKTANFGIIYGISAFGLATRLGIPRGEAKEIIDGYFASFPGVQHYIDREIEKAREKGYVDTIYGRKRFLPDIRSGNAVVRGLAERNAINAPIQGSAADIMKLAMIAVEKALREGGYQSRITLQVHDELVLNVHPSELEAVRKIVVDNMEHAAALKVPLVVDCEAGENWLEAH
ncbi:DNA polymerase I [Alistipes sp. OttesenSCG-928-L06]|nr:DNA polymerase I [Alistipes sp. OttesenSCG-928-L06]